MAKHGRHSANGGYSRTNAPYASAQSRPPRHVRPLAKAESPAYPSFLDEGELRQLSSRARLQGDASSYARENYGSGSNGAKRSSSGRLSTGKKVAIGIGVAAGVIVIALVVYLLWFSSTLNSILAPSSDVSEQLKAELVDVEAGKPFYMLLLGSDSREGSGTSKNPSEMGDQQRSDVIVLARIDPQTKTVTLVSVPRDTPYEWEDGTIIKINEAYNRGGAAASIRAVSKLTGVPISHYAEVHVSELEAIVNALGGVDVYVDRDLEVHDTLTNEQYFLSAGWQTLDGKLAQVFARDRHSYGDTAEGAEYHRQGNVRTLLQAIVKKLFSRPIPELPATILELAQYVTTDLQTGDLVSLAMSFAGGDIKMYSCTGPSNGGLIEEYGGVWFCYPNPEGWAALMAQVDAGVEPKKIDYKATQIKM